MKVIITGCEYTGASTLARDFCDWLYDKYGGRGKFRPRSASTTTSRFRT